MALPFPDIDPIALSLGPLQIRWYALAYLVGFLMGWRYILMLAKKMPGRPDKNDIDDFVPWAVAGVILGGRIGYVLFYNLPFYAGDPWEALKIWQGGMSFHGGAAGVILALFIYPMRRGFSVLRLSDLVCAAVPIGLFFGRIANFINGELYGRAAPNVPWAVVFPGGGEIPRHPSQLYEAVLEGAVLFIILLALYRMKSVRERPGLVSAAFLIGYGVFRGFVEFFREPDAQIGFVIGQISMGQILCLPMIVFGAGIIIYALRRTRLKFDGQPAK